MITNSSFFQERNPSTLKVKFHGQNLIQTPLISLESSLKQILSILQWILWHYIHTDTSITVRYIIREFSGTNNIQGISNFHRIVSNTISFKKFHRISLKHWFYSSENAAFRNTFSKDFQFFTHLSEHEEAHICTIRWNIYRRQYN